jgi:hypothetical protein
VKAIASPIIRKVLEQKITIEEVQKAIDKMKPGKSPDPDGLGAEFYKNLKFTISNHLLALYVEAQTAGFFPETLTEGTLSLLFKKGDPREVRNYRPISRL